MMKTEQKPSVRLLRNGQYVPQVNGVDTSPTSFDKDRAMEIARQACLMTPTQPQTAQHTKGLPEKISCDSLGRVFDGNGEQLLPSDDLRREVVYRYNLCPELQRFLVAYQQARDDNDYTSLDEWADELLGEATP